MVSRIPMLSRFYSEKPVVSDHAELSGSEAHHLHHVLRADIGTEIVIWDGSGREFDARVLKMDRSTVFCKIVSVREVCRELPVTVTLGVALPKGERQRWLVEKTVELGVTTIVPLMAERSVARPTQSALGRMRRTVIEASKQCRRNRTAEIATAQQVGDFLACCPDEALRWIAHPEPSKPSRSLFDCIHTLNTPTKHVCLAIGPEGGFSDQEIEWSDRYGWHRVDLGPRTLRVETAAVALLAAVALNTV